MKIIHLKMGDTLTMKKPHPCGSNQFTVTRIGSDIRIKCVGCGHDITVERIKLEKNIKRVTDFSGNTRE